MNSLYIKLSALKYVFTKQEIFDFRWFLKIIHEPWSDIDFTFEGHEYIYI
jgi:hypothetical protein